MTTKIDQLITSQNSQLTVTVARKLVEYTKGGILYDRVLLNESLK